MKNSKEIQEEFNDLNVKFEELLEKDSYTDEEYNALNDPLDILAKELKRVKAQEDRNLVISAVVGTGSSISDLKEKTIMAADVNFAKSILETSDTGKQTGLELEVQSIADSEKEESGITSRECYKSKNILATIPGSFIKYGPYDPRLENGKLDTKATIDVGTEGTDVVQTTILGVTPALSVTNAAMEAGATIMPNQVGDLQIAKGSSLTMAWEGETDPDADATGSFTNFSLSPSRLGGRIPISWQMLKQSAFNQNSFWRGQLAQYIGSTLDAALFHGAVNGPTGIDSETGVTDYSSTFNPGEAVLTWDMIVNLETQVGVANALKGNLAYCYPSKVASQTKTTFKNTGTSSDNIILEPGGKTINGYPTFISNNILDDYSSDNDKAYMFFGNFADLIVAFWGGIDILENPYLLAGTATTVLHSNLYVNGGTLNGESFAFVNNILIT